MPDMEDYMLTSEIGEITSKKSVRIIAFFITGKYVAYFSANTGNYKRLKT